MSSNKTKTLLKTYEYCTCRGTVFNTYDSRGNPIGETKSWSDCRCSDVSSCWEQHNTCKTMFRDEYLMVDLNTHKIELKHEYRYPRNY